MYASKNSTVATPKSVGKGGTKSDVGQALKNGLRSRFLVTLCMTFKMGVNITLYRFDAVFAQS
jgi:hypothetical protein